MFWWLFSELQVAVRFHFCQLQKIRCNKKYCIISISFCKLSFLVIVAKQDGFPGNRFSTAWLLVTHVHQEKVKSSRNRHARSVHNYVWTLVSKLMCVDGFSESRAFTIVILEVTPRTLRTQCYIFSVTSGYFDR